MVFFSMYCRRHAIKPGRVWSTCRYLRFGENVIEAGALAVWGNWVSTFFLVVVLCLSVRPVLGRVVGIADLGAVHLSGILVHVLLCPFEHEVLIPHVLDNRVHEVVLLP